MRKPEKIATVRLNSPYTFEPVTLSLMIGEYQKGGPAVWLDDQTGEQFCVLSVYAYDSRQEYTPGLVRRHPRGWFAKHWDGQGQILEHLEAEGIIERIEGEACTLGHVPGVQAYQIAERFLAEAELKRAAAYLKIRGVCCPYCGCVHLEGGKISTQDSGEATQPVKCTQCGRDWLDRYKLAAVTFYDCDGDPVAMVLKNSGEPAAPPAA